jgi:hypothetical protein
MFEIWGRHSVDCEEYCVPGSDAILSVNDTSIPGYMLSHPTKR